MKLSMGCTFLARYACTTLKPCPHPIKPPDVAAAEDTKVPSHHQYCVFGLQAAHRGSRRALLPAGHQLQEKGQQNTSLHHLASLIFTRTVHGRHLHTAPLI